MSACKGACSCAMRNCDAKQKNNRATIVNLRFIHGSIIKFRAEVNRLAPSYLLSINGYLGLIRIEIVDFDQGHAGGVVTAAHDGGIVAGL